MALLAPLLRVLGRPIRVAWWPNALERSQLRSAELNYVDMAAALHLGIAVARVPAYSPDAVTEYALGLGLTRNGKIHRLCAMRKGNFTLAGSLRGKENGRASCRERVCQYV